MGSKRERLMPLGCAFLGVGGSLAVGYLIYTLQDASRGFWRWPGVLGLAVLLTGVLLFMIGYAAPSSKADPHGAKSRIDQKLHSGRGSTNYQAGRDITVSGEKRET